MVLALVNYLFSFKVTPLLVPSVSNFGAFLELLGTLVPILASSSDPEHMAWLWTEYQFRFPSLYSVTLVCMEANMRLAHCPHPLLLKASAADLGQFQAWAALGGRGRGPGPPTDSRDPFPALCFPPPSLHSPGGKEEELPLLPVLGAGWGWLTGR